jgi:hypothetical protein
MRIFKFVVKFYFMQVDSKLIERIFLSEFQCIRDKFEVITYPLSQLRGAKDSNIWNPGVYVYHRTLDVLKVGLSLTNSKKRALEHVGATTGDKMDVKTEQADATVTLFNVINKNDSHWVAAVEIFLEDVLSPVVRSGRRG